MKKLLLLIIVPFFTYTQTGWTYKVEDDPFDGKTLYALASGYMGTSPYNNPGFIIRYTDNKGLEAYIRDLGYSGCDDNKIEIAFDNSKFNIEVFYVNKSVNRGAVFLKLKI